MQLQEVGKKGQQKDDIRKKKVLGNWRKQANSRENENLAE